MSTTLKIVFAFLVLSFLVIRPTTSYAWHDGWRGHGYVAVNLGWPGPYYGYPYYYGYPNYYDYPAYPAYAVSASPSYQAVVVNGVTYYVNNGAYYIYTQYGYQAVPAPSGATAPVVQAAVVSVPPDADDSFTINIPNDKGGYNAVLIKRSGKGFVGPQGEFYTEFPKVSQLRMMYGK